MDSDSSRIEHLESNFGKDFQADADKQLDAIFRALPDLMFYMDASGKILSFKAGDSSSLYLKPEEFLGKLMQEILPFDIGEKFSHALREAVGTRKTTSLQYQLNVPSGLCWFEARLVAMENDRVIAIIRDVTERFNSDTKLQKQVSQLSSLQTIDSAIATHFNMDAVLETILEQITSQLGVDAADILLLDAGSRALVFAAAHGFRKTSLEHASVEVGKGFAGTAVSEKQMVRVPILSPVKQGNLVSPDLIQEKFTSYYAIPLITRDRVMGVLEIYHRTILKPTEDWFDFLATLGHHAALAIYNTLLVRDLQQSNNELSHAYDATIQGWSQALELRDEETEGHTHRVLELTEELVREMGIKELDMEQVRRGALLHDIGKIAIPDSILLKAGPLNNYEWEIMRQHPQYAYHLLSPISYLQPALVIPYCHHEKWDGSGYPRGLKGEQIPLAARIFAVVDVFDALTSNRPYRQAWTLAEAVEYIQSQSGRYFDPNVVDAFLDMIRRENT